jgi:hypothetical protein
LKQGDDTLGRKGGLKGGLARAARLTPAKRSASATKAVRARRAKSGKGVTSDDQTTEKSRATRVSLPPADDSDRSLALLLKRLRTATDLAEIRELAEKIERVAFHKQFDNAKTFLAPEMIARGTEVF